jgi:hypothetical protein
MRFFENLSKFCCRGRDRDYSIKFGGISTIFVRDSYDFAPVEKMPLRYFFTSEIWRELIDCDQIDVLLFKDQLEAIK